MTRGNAATSERIWPVVLALAILTILLRGPGFGNPVAGMDSQLYSYIGWKMLSGDLPFADFWDRKPFGLFALFAGAHLIGGPTSMAYQALAMLFTLGGAVLTFRMARPLTDRCGAAIAGAVYIVFMVAYGGDTGQSEAFFVPMMMLAAYWLRDWQREDFLRRSIAAMALCGVALQVKYSVLPQCIMLGLWALWGQYRRGAAVPRLVRLGALFVGLGLLPTILVGLLYLVAGEWDAFFYANFVSFFDRAGVYESRFYERQIIWIIPFAVPLIGAAYYALRVERPRDLGIYGYYVLWSVSALATVVFPKTIYMFYLASLAPCIALLTTPLYAKGTLLRAGPAVLLLIGFINILDLPGRYEKSAQDRSEYEHFAHDLAPYVGTAEGCLYVFDGPMELYRSTNSCTLTHLIYPDHLNNRLEMHSVGVPQHEELERILAQRPGAIVIAHRSVTPQNPLSVMTMYRALLEDYEPVAAGRVDWRVLTGWARKDRNDGAVNDVARSGRPG